MPFTGSKVAGRFLALDLPPQLYNRRHYPMSPAENAVSVERKERRGEKEKERINKHYFTKCIPEVSIMETWIRW